jgi:polyisoprenoid-binding protein YceI
MKMKKLALLLFGFAMVAGVAHADNYVIDKKGMHASIQFKISHLGYSWLWGRFNDFEGTFSYDPDNPAASKVSVNIDPASVDSNHAERDKHLRSDDFLYVDKFPESRFVSTSYTQNADGSGVLKGDFTLRGVTRPITIDVQFTGAGKDPWGGYRAGFEGKTRIALADYGITKDLGPASKELDLIIAVEGVRQ